MALQGQVAALQEAQGEQQKAEAADQDPGKAAEERRLHKGRAVLRAVVLTVCAVLIVLIAAVWVGISYQSGEGDAGANVMAWNMPLWLIAVIVGFFAAAVAACVVSVVHRVRDRKAKGREKEQTDKNK